MEISSQIVHMTVVLQYRTVVIVFRHPPDNHHCSESDVVYCSE